MLQLFHSVQVSLSVQNAICSWGLGQEEELVFLKIPPLLPLCSLCSTRMGLRLTEENYRAYKQESETQRDVCLFSEYKPDNSLLKEVYVTTDSSETRG